MRAIQNTAFGNPVETLKLIDTTAPGKPGAGEVLVAMEFAPINGNDMLIITGQFKFDTDLPSFVGNEGVGRVVEVGAGVTNVKAGDRVLAPLYSWTWREQMIFAADGLLALPTQVAPQQLAMARINPVTAVLLLDQFVDLKEGDWVVQNMANGGIGRSVIALAKQRGLRTISFVRRAELVDELKSAGADIVLIDGPGATEQVKQIVGDGNVRLAIDGLSGSHAARLIDLLSQNGVLVSYSSLSGDMNIPVNALDLQARGIVVRGIYQGLPEYAAAIPGAIRTSVDLLASGELTLAVDAVYPISEFTQAVEHSLRGGKVLLDLRN
ncbi:zinc-dependent alcohol dehydrogenase family protein [Duganella callida]|uniref:enoyl-[acyl-carrier-protein] reductase n=1 Tax=Duganella callida TaxID=2561932 RepID=A0A4Y9SD42_9BURK|nr:zinc-dependent alcohol dehydrogenase family protein [Duganella callida]TFW18677.1 alcohol dehydrogenase [Duganella callida]